MHIVPVPRWRLELENHFSHVHLLVPSAAVADAHVRDVVVRILARWCFDDADNKPSHSHESSRLGSEYSCRLLSFAGVLRILERHLFSLSSTKTRPKW